VKRMLSTQLSVPALQSVLVSSAASVGQLEQTGPVNSLCRGPAFPLQEFAMWLTVCSAGPAGNMSSMA